MAAYLVAQIEVTDPAKYEQYRQEAAGVVQQYGGRYLVRGGAVEALEGSHDGRRLVVLEFSSIEAVRAFWHSPEYQETRKLREASAVTDMWAVSGL